MAKNVYLIIKEIECRLEPHYESASHANTVAWWLLERLTQKNKLQLITQITISLSPVQDAQLAQWITTHIDNSYPLQYILGSVPFGPLQITVEAPTLIPRPETEEWVSTLIATLEPVKHEKLTLLDMCTGSGCIALWLAKEFPNATIFAVDISDTALALAEKNARHNNISNIRFIRSDLFSMLSETVQFDLIVANPPYIDPQDWNDLSSTVRTWEDRGALVAGNKGLEILIQIAAQAPHYLNQQSILRTYGFPKLVVEIGYNQGEIVKQLFIATGFGTVRVLNDSAGRNRVVSGW